MVFKILRLCSRMTASQTALHFAFRRKLQNAYHSLICSFQRPNAIRTPLANWSLLKEVLICHSKQESETTAVETSRKSNYNHDLNIAFNMIPKIKLTVARNIERRTSIPSVFF